MKIFTQFSEIIKQYSKLKTNTWPNRLSKRHKDNNN